MTDSALTDPTPAVGPRPKQRRTLLVVGILAGLVLALVAVIALVNQAAVSNSRVGYQTAWSEYSVASDELIEAHEARATTVAEVSADEVEDAALVEALATLTPIDQPVFARLDVETSNAAELDEATAELEAATAGIRAEVEAITGSVEAVLASREARLLSAAGDAIRESIASAETALADTEGLVPDDGLREDLASLITSAKDLLAAASPSAAELDAVRVELDAQRDVVTASRIAKFEDINGTWCAWPDGTRCLNVALPLFGESSKVVADDNAATYENEECFFRAVVPIREGPGSSSSLAYCPRGNRLSAGFEVTFENANHDRMYLYHGAGIDPYFRQEEFAAAAAGQ